jgi:hypothetical protein
MRLWEWFCEGDTVGLKLRERDCENEALGAYG